MGRGARANGPCRRDDARRRRPRRVGRHDLAAPARSGGARSWRHHQSLGRRDRHLHRAGLSLPCRRSAADEFPSAAVHAVHAGGGLRRAGAHEAGLRACHRRAIPLLFLRRLFSVAAMSLSFELLPSDGPPRLRRIATAHGSVETPAFMPLGTARTIKAMLPQSVAETGAEIVLGNTFHLMLRPGAERGAALGGLHKFMNWPRPILSDSGGFQVMSLKELRQLDADGVTFRSPIDGSEHRLTPERSIEIQKLLDADITMSFDECTSWPVEEPAAAASMRLSMKWAERRKRAFSEGPGYGLFGIVQGSTFPALRAESGAALTNIGFDGYAVGGLAVGEGQAAMFSTLDVTLPMLPADRPRYLMGVGRPAAIAGAVKPGIA